MAKLKITQTDTSGQIHDRYVSPAIVNGYHFGGTGGLTSQTGYQILPQVDTGNGPAAGSIITQKGARKFLCTDGTTRKICKLVPSRVPDGGPGQMSIPFYSTTISGNVADTAGAQTSSYLRYQISSIVGSTDAIKVGAQVHSVGQSINGNVVITAINATVGGYGNVTVNFSLQDGDPPSGNYTMQVGGYASRITNKFVYDFAGNKYRYRLAAPDDTFVQVASA
jgi:hypothetical protein